MKRQIALVCGFALITLYAVAVSAQSQERVVMWPPVAIGQIKSAGPGVELSSVTEAVQLSDILVAGHSIIPGQPFAADDDWLRTLTVRLKNVSGYNIVGAQVIFGLPDTKTGERQVGFSLGYGKYGTGDGQALVKPDEEFELKFSDVQYRRYLDFLTKQAASVNFTKILIGITAIKFEDGTTWSSGCLGARDSRAACTTPAP